MVGTIKTNKGFYVGDICYALSDEVYHGVWGKAHYEDGEYEVNGYKFAMGGTAHGDGCYCDKDGNVYGVDAGNIGVVPMELLREDFYNGGMLVYATECAYSFNRGKFIFRFNNGELIDIDTK